jgi:HEAT repeat protein
VEDRDLDGLTVVSRGFDVITHILGDRSDRPRGQGVAIVRRIKLDPNESSFDLAEQIRADRYHGAHLFGDLRDPRAVPILVPLLKDPEVNSVVPWALGQIGDRSAIPALIDALDDKNASIVVSVIYALEELRAKEAVPRLMSLLTDDRKSNSGGQVSVADVTRAAISKLQ